MTTFSCPQCNHSNTPEAAMCWNCYEQFQPHPSQSPVKSAPKWSWPVRAEKQEELTPIERIANTILHYALVDGATQIRFSPGVRGVPIEYEIEGQWCLQMKISAIVWPELKHHFLPANSSRNTFLFEEEGHSQKVRAELEVAEQHEFLHLRLESPASTELSA